MQLHFVSRLWLAFFTLFPYYRGLGELSSRVRSTIFFETLAYPNFYIYLFAPIIRLLDSYKLHEILFHHRSLGPYKFIVLESYCFAQVSLTSRSYCYSTWLHCCLRSFISQENAWLHLRIVTTNLHVRFLLVIYVFRIYKAIVDFKVALFSLVLIIFRTPFLNRRILKTRVQECTITLQYNISKLSLQVFALRSLDYLQPSSLSS